jgi:hypothetical protein
MPQLAGVSGAKSAPGVRRMQATWRPGATSTSGGSVTLQAGMA